MVMKIYYIYIYIYVYEAGVSSPGCRPGQKYGSSGLPKHQNPPLGLAGVIQRSAGH